MKSARELREAQGIRNYDSIALIKELEHYINLASKQGEREIWFNAMEYSRDRAILPAIWHLEELGYRVVEDPVDCRYDKITHTVYGTRNTLHNYLLVEW